METETALKNGAELKAKRVGELKYFEIMKWFVKCMKQYTDFGGRARRTEFWMFVLFNFIFAIVASILDSAIGSKIGIIKSVLLALSFTRCFDPGLAVSVRRLHDMAKAVG